MIRRCFIAFALCLLSSAAVATDADLRTHAFADPIDAISLGMPTDAIDVAIRGFDGTAWTGWYDLEIEEEFDPMLRESNLVVFPRPVVRLEIRGSTAEYALHPIRISRDPIRWTVAARDGGKRPRILSRDDWGADASLLFIGQETTRSDIVRQPEEKGNGEEQSSGTVPKRVSDCEEAQRRYPREFRPERTVTHDTDGQRYRWPLSYSAKVRLLVVHHTALAVGTDPRPAVERVRALYQYHAENRGWGDIGYHYLVDENGQIYEGKAGGPRVVGGHAYCANTGTIGIALLGDFEREQPTQAQMRSLQELLDELAELYDIALDRSVRFHGTIFPAIVGHRDLLPTDCPGYYVSETLGQVRENVRRGDLLAAIDFPRKPSLGRSRDRTAQRRAQRLQKARRTPNPSPSPSPSPIIRLRLSYDLSTAHIAIPEGTTINGAPAASSGISLSLADGTCRGTLRIAPRGGTVTLRLKRGRSAAASGEGYPERAQRVEGHLPLRVKRGGLPPRSLTISSWEKEANRFRGIVECRVIDGRLTLINELPLEEYLAGLSEEPDTEPFEKQRAFAIAARTYAAHYLDSTHRKFPGAPYDGSDSAATFQAYGGVTVEERNPQWVRAVQETAGLVLKKDGQVIRPPYFHSDDGRTRSPTEAGWMNFPFAEIFTSKPDPWCRGLPLQGHGVGMSGCGARGQALEGKSAEEILQYYYPGTQLHPMPEENSKFQKPKARATSVLRNLETT